jgi:hypothetical protein
VPSKPGPVILAAGDVDNDGRVDIAVIGRNDSTLSFLLSNGNGTFRPTTPIFLPPTDPNASTVDPEAVQLVDLDGDNRLDVVLVAHSLGELWIFWNDST